MPLCEINTVTRKYYLNKPIFNCINYLFFNLLIIAQRQWQPSYIIALFSFRIPAQLMVIFGKYCVISWPVVSNLWEENSLDSAIVIFRFSNTYLLYNRRYTDLSKSCYLILIRNKHVKRLHTSYNVEYVLSIDYLLQFLLFDSNRRIVQLEKDVCDSSWSCFGHGLD